MNQCRSKIDKMTWSFSRLNTYFTCPRAFKLQYIDKAKQRNNAFAEFGSYVHEIFEKFYSNEWSCFELAFRYDAGYADNVITPFPFQKMGVGYYNKGLVYFENFKNPFEDFEVLGVEQNIEVEINGFKFTGFIDLVLKNDDGIIIVDHKSKKELKDGDELDHYLMQLYLYSIWVHDHYGEYPKHLAFNMFRAGEIKTTVFSTEKLEKAKDWFTGLINEIYEDKHFVAVYPSDFYCKNLCSVYEQCKKEDADDADTEGEVGVSQNTDWGLYG